MADIGKHVHVYLQTKSSVTDLASTRGFPGPLKGRITDDSYSYRTVGGQSTSDVGGFKGVAVGIVEIQSYSTTHLGAASLRDAIHIALMATLPLTMDSNVVTNITHQSGPIDLTEAPIDGNDAWRYRIADTYRIIYSESTS